MIGLSPRASVSLVLGTIIALVLLAVVPAWLSSYWQSVLVLFGISAIAVMGYRFITTMGDWSFAHVAIMGLGAYSMALLMSGRSPGFFWLSLLAGPLAAALFAMLIAYPVLRTRQYYFFLSTFAAGEALRQCFIQFSGITGGTYGIAFIPRPSSLFGVDFTQTLAYYHLVLLLFAVVAAGLYIIDRSRLGATIKAVAENEPLSQSIGINTWAHRTFAFVLGSTIAGLAGVLLGNFNGIINPLDFRSAAMFKVVAAVIVGGRTTFLGCLLGLAFLTAIEEVFRSQAQLVPLLWGVSVIVILLFSKGGLESLVLNAWAWVAHRRQMGVATEGGPR